MRKCPMSDVDDEKLIGVDRGGRQCSGVWGGRVGGPEDMQV